MHAHPHHQWGRGTPGSQGAETFCSWAARKGKRWGTFQFTTKELDKNTEESQEWWGQRREGQKRSLSNRREAGWEQEIQSQPGCLHPFKGRECAKLVKESRPRALENSIFITALMTFPLSTRLSREIHLQGKFFLSTVRRPDKETS